MTIRIIGVCDGGQIRSAGHGTGIGDRTVYGVALTACPNCNGAGCPLPSTVLRIAARLAAARSGAPGSAE